MNFTGTNTLFTPQVSQATYLFRDIVVNSTGTYRIGTSHFVNNVPTMDWSGWLFHLQNGRIFEPSGKFVATYNTGEAFSLSGWIDFPSQSRYLEIGDILVSSQESAPTSGLLRAIKIFCPTGATLSCDLRLQSTRLETTAQLSGLPIFGYVSGELQSSVTQVFYNDGFHFYQSYENLLTGTPVAAFVDPRFSKPVTVRYIDNDTSRQNNLLNFDYQYQTTYKTPIQEFTLARTGLFNSGIVQLVDVNTESGFSGMLDGLWSGTRFMFSGGSNSLILNYFMTFTDAMGNPYPMSGGYSVRVGNTGQSMRAEYITGFRLTASGQYMNPPLIRVTGYYYSTGIQQSIGSLLFSSGCTGNLAVTFSAANSIGTGASGLLLTTPVTFSGVYSNGQKTFRTVYGYTTTNVGTGYTIAPAASVNTGQYGANCFDVPLASGYNQAWFAPFRTSGTIDVEAGWFTGIALTTTGIVSGGATGYIVTGIDVYNIGTGYNNNKPPLMSFIRTGVDSLTSNASGVFSMNTGSINSGIKWTVQAGIAGQSPSLSGHAGTIPLTDSNTMMYVKVTCTEVDITVPITGHVTVTMTNVSPQVSVTTPFRYSKYFNTGADALKKKLNPVGMFSTSTDLGFLLTQNELDTLYSAAGYTNNSWPFSEGDFDF